MSKVLPNDLFSERAEIEIKEVSSNYSEVFYIPNESDIEHSKYKLESPRKHKKKVIVFDGQRGHISIYPIITLPTHPRYLDTKYDKIEEITISGNPFVPPQDIDEVISTLENFPAGFIRDIQYGLGLTKDLRFIISAIEEQTNHKTMVISKENTNTGSGDSFYLNRSNYEELRRDCNRIAERARKVARITKEIVTYNRVAFLLGNEQKLLPTSEDAISKMLKIKITDTDKQAAINLITGDRSAIKKSDFSTISRLRNDIELVSLDLLIDRFSELLGKKTKEETWQKLLNENPFILSLAFGYPAIKISDQASVGGKRISGDGEKITDYLIKNEITNNLALIEIKKPSSVLINKKPYRNAVYCASTELTGSVTQILDQRYQLQNNLSSIKINSRIYDIESYSIHCILVIGTIPSDDDMKKSFEMYRQNSKSVQIITFDELLLKLKQLHAFLSNRDTTG